VTTNSSLTIERGQRVKGDEKRICTIVSNIHSTSNFPSRQILSFTGERPRPPNTATMPAILCFSRPFIQILLLSGQLSSVLSLSTMLNCHSFAVRWANRIASQRPYIYWGRSHALSSLLHSSSGGIEGTPTTAVTTIAAAAITNFIPGPDLPPVGNTAKRLFLVRHGEVINPGGDRSVYYGAMDVPLSSLGMDEAKAAAGYLQKFDLEFVVASPLSRAIYGAEQVLERQQRRQSSTSTPNQNSSRCSDVIQILEGFKELDRGSWCGLTKDEIGVDMMSRFDACDESVTPKGGESYLTLKERVLQARDETLSMVSPGKSAAIVSHLQVTRCMVSDALGIPPNQMAGLKVATASITCIDYDDDTTIDTGTSMTQTVLFQSFKPEVGFETSKDGAN
jgi:broad specificity phosphatase PhoE